MGLNFLWTVSASDIILKNVSFLEKMNITLEMFSICFLINGIIECIGVYVVRIVQNIRNMVDDKLNKEIVESNYSASELLLDIFNESIGAFFIRKTKASNENIDPENRLESLYEESNTLVLQHIGATTIAVWYVVESNSEAGEYSEDISEIVINYLVGTEKVKAI